MKATIKTGLSLGATLALAMLSNATLATENPFSANTLESGYQQPKLIPNSVKVSAVKASVVPKTTAKKAKAKQ